MVAADARTALRFSLTPGQAGDAPARRECSASSETYPLFVACLRTLRMKAMNRVHCLLIWVSSRSSRRIRCALNRGSSKKPGTDVATRSSDGAVD